MIPRKYIFIAIVFLLILTGFSILAFSWKESRAITFAIDYPGASATISEKGSNATLGTVNNGTSLRLDKKVYEFTFTGQEFSQNPIEATVDDKTSTITLTPLLSQGKLNALLAQDKEAIDTAIKSTIKNSSSYIEGERELYHHGEWCTTSFTVAAPASSGDSNIGSLDNTEIYYVILEKKDNKWSVAAGPHLIITKPDYPNIPDYVIDSIDPSRVE